MKKLLSAFLVACTLSLGATAALAHEPAIDDRYDDRIMHPLRLAAYVVHPIGFAAEWLVGRPIQYIISRDHLREIFGYRSLSEEETYRRLGGDL
jgi:hypothetical protein